MLQHRLRTCRHCHWRAFVRTTTSWSRRAFRSSSSRWPAPQPGLRAWAEGSAVASTPPSRPLAWKVTCLRRPRRSRRCRRRSPLPSSLRIRRAPDLAVRVYALLPGGRVGLGAAAHHRSQQAAMRIWRQSCLQLRTRRRQRAQFVARVLRSRRLQRAPAPSRCWTTCKIPVCPFPNRCPWSSARHSFRLLL